ncbi:transposase [Streptomyces flaveolus]
MTDGQWARLEPLLPAGKRPGRPRTWTRRQLVDGIRWRTRAGACRRDVPERYGPWGRVYYLSHRWQRRHMEADPGATAGPCGLVGLPCPPARRWRAQRGGLQREPPGGVDIEPDGHGQKPLSLLITAGHRHDSPQFSPSSNASACLAPFPDARALCRTRSVPTKPKDPV